MNIQIVLSPEVLNELKNAAHWYNQQQDGLGNELIDSFWEELNYVKSYPQAFPIFNKRRGLRHLVFKRFPYLICFSLENGTLYVGRFVHIKQNPRKRTMK